MNTMVQPFKELGQIKVAALIGAAVVLIGFFIFVSMRVAAPMMSPLFTNLPTEEGAKIMQELDQRNIPYELRAGGTQIMVPSDQVNKLRLVMAEQGIPSRGSVVGYEIFDKTDSMGTSNFVLNLNQLRALEGELARTITDFQAVEQARVHLVMPKRELFTRDTVDPTASVALKLRQAGGLAKNEIAAIRHLVATAVPGLKPQRVTIVDSRGALLAKGVDEENDKNVLTEEAEDFRVVYEKRLADTIERLLERSIGHGKVKAEVHADIDFDRTITNSEKYDPEGQVARSIQSITENEKSNERSMDQTVSVANQLPDPNATNGGAGSNAESNRGRTEETTNFEISKQVVNSVKETGNVKRLSVAVLVDGVYSKNEAGDEVYNPRSEEELEKLRQLVNSAIGFDESRGDEVEVVNLQFAAPEKDIFEDDGMGWLKDDLNSIIQTLVLGGVAILAILMVIRPLVARAIESAEASQREDELEQAALAAPSIAARLTDQSRLSEGDDDEVIEEEMINIDRIQGKVKSSSYNKINSMVEKHPEETLQIIRQWLIS